MSTPRVFDSSAMDVSVLGSVDVEYTGSDDDTETPMCPTSPNRGPSLDLDLLIQQDYHLAENHAAQELLYRLNHARQTVDFVTKQVRSYQTLSRCQMNIWEALELLGDLREYEAALLGDDDVHPEMPLVDHAFQCAAICREAFPSDDWMALVGLIHGLGKLLAHEKFGTQPQWCVCGESFPVGCRFSSSIANANFFQANPDRRKRQFSSPLGVYRQHCGLRSVFMSWSSAEYLYMMLALNKTDLPREALWLVRYQKFRSIMRPGQPYYDLLSDFDITMLPKLEKFVNLVQYKRRDDIVVDKEELKSYCQGLIDKYVPNKVLRW
jgi:inositol oxygenase